MRVSRNIAARDAHTASVLRSVGVVDTLTTLTACEAADALFGWVYKQPGNASYEDCKEVLSRLKVERGLGDAEAALQRFGCGGISELRVDQYAEFYRYVTTALYLGVSPTYAWRDSSDIPDDLRDRWLLWHNEKDCVWEVRGALLGVIVDGETIEDVSGDSYFERRFANQTCSVQRDEL